MKLNLGSGPHPWEGWVNIDVDPTWVTNVAASVYWLPFRDASFEAAYLGHFAEHLPWRSIPVAMAEVQRVCRPGAEVMVVGPDMDRAVLRAVARLEPLWLLGDIRGSQPLGDHSGGGGHAWMPTEGFTVEALEMSGFVDVTPFDVADVPEDYPCASRAPWQCAVKATVP